jgi:hypothetical protein
VLVHDTMINTKNRVCQRQNQASGAQKACRSAGV